MPQLMRRILMLYCPIKLHQFLHLIAIFVIYVIGKIRHVHTEQNGIQLFSGQIVTHNVDDGFTTIVYLNLLIHLIMSVSIVHNVRNLTDYIFIIILIIIKVTEDVQ